MSVNGNEQGGGWGAEVPFSIENEAEERIEVYYVRTQAQLSQRGFVAFFLAISRTFLYLHTYISFYFYRIFSGIFLSKNVSETPRNVPEMAQQNVTPFLPWTFLFSYSS